MQSAASLLTRHVQKILPKGHSYLGLFLLLELFFLPPPPPPPTLRDDRVDLLEHTDRSSELFLL